MHRRDQSNFVAANIKHGEFSYLVGVSKRSLAVARSLEIGFSA